jgi:hypothetical protein
VQRGAAIVTKLIQHVRGGRVSTIEKEHPMRINKTYILAGMVIAFALFFELAAHAQVLLMK